MAERTGPGRGLCGRQEQLCCISVNKIFDSARDKDCLEDMKVYLCAGAQEIIDRSNAIRCKNVEVIYTNISLESVPFNRGFYQVTVRYFFCVTLECCVGIGRAMDVKGLCAFDKKVILYGSEKNVSVFTSDPANNNFCADLSDLRCDSVPTLPTVVVEVADPICLDTKVVERIRPFGNCCCTVEAIPDAVRNRFDDQFVDGMGINNVYVTVGMFSVIRMERTVQLVLPACNFCLPEKESTPAHTDNPCGIFGKMNFPLAEFYPYADEQLPREERRENQNGCGCRDTR